MSGPRNSAYAVNLTYNRHTPILSREISIEHPSVGLASLAKLENWFPLQGERGHFLSFGVFKKIERKGDRTTDLSIYPTL